ncbi:alpha/beta hydrolase [Methylopila henanensis]|uniref:Alpha/beta hydrolase n=1 Tax=Methylopila henanensis TaxID=873516 RepID=A0ABW4KBR5_9HYPH
MPKSLLALFLGLLVALSGVASAQELPGGVVERNQTAPSPALGRDLVYNLYRPAFPPQHGEAWPTLYLLEGRPSESDWLDMGGIASLLDRAIAEGRIPPMLVVMPVAPYSWYVDNPDAGGRGLMKTAITRDLRAALEARFPVAACREARAVAGLSMGGYGALLFGLDEPDLFASAISLSGAIAPPIAEKDRARVVRADQFYDGAFGAPLERERFNALTAFGRLDALKDRLGPKPAIYLAIGDRDRGGLLQSTTLLHSRLLRAGVESTLRIGAGAHDWETWSRDMDQAFGWLGPRLDASCGAAVAAREGVSTR